MQAWITEPWLRLGSHRARVIENLNGRGGCGSENLKREPSAEGLL